MRGKEESVLNTMFQKGRNIEWTLTANSIKCIQLKIYTRARSSAIGNIIVIIYAAGDFHWLFD